jgi:hypothetical protein
MKLANLEKVNEFIEKIREEIIEQKQQLLRNQVEIVAK